MTLVCGKEVTLPNLERYLDVIDYVAPRMLEQNFRAAYEPETPSTSGCLFRHRAGSNLVACSLGMLVSDSLADDAWDVKRHFEKLGYWKNGKHGGFAEELRSIHNQHMPVEWPKLFAELRAKYQDQKQVAAYYEWQKTGKSADECWEAVQAA